MTDVTRGEFDMLRETVTELARRQDAMDQGGTRGVGVLAVQIQELSKDFAKHEKDHETAEANRRVDRWKFIGLITILISPIYPLIYYIHR